MPLSAGPSQRPWFTFEMTTGGSPHWCFNFVLHIKFGGTPSAPVVSVSPISKQVMCEAGGRAPPIKCLCVKHTDLSPCALHSGDES